MVLMGGTVSERLSGERLVPDDIFSDRFAGWSVPFVEKATPFACQVAPLARSVSSVTKTFDI